MIRTTPFVVSILLLSAGFGAELSSKAKASPPPPPTPTIFPLPLDMQAGAGVFEVNEHTSIVLPERPGETDEFLARWWRHELIDYHRTPLEIVRTSRLPTDRGFILIGELSNPLVRRQVSELGLLAALEALGDEGYVLSVSNEGLVVAGNTRHGALLGLQSLRQLVSKQDGRVVIPQLLVKDAPRLPFRAIRLHLPGRENFTYFKRFIRDFAALYKFNTIVMECNAHMRLDSRPELNIGAVDFARALNTSRMNRPSGPNGETQTSTHHACADGEILEKEEVRDLVNYMRSHGLEVVPELPSLTHAYYLLFGNKHLAESLHYEFPDTYCPLKPGSHRVYFDVLDEYIEVMKPKMIHIGHDEWRMEMDKCELCRGRDYGELFAGDVRTIHAYLAERGIETAMWGDHLMEAHAGHGPQPRKTRTGYEYMKPGALRPDQVQSLIPKDILVFNWGWSRGKAEDEELASFGLRQVYGNFLPVIDRWQDRAEIPGVLGGAPSAWTASAEFNVGKDFLWEFLGTANLLWSRERLDLPQLTFRVESMVPGIRARLSGRPLPSELGSRVEPLDLAPYRNASLPTGPELPDAVDLKGGRVEQGRRVFDLDAASSGSPRIVRVRTGAGSGSPDAVRGIPIERDVDSILFLHASAREGRNTKGHTLHHNPIETAQLLGWYEIVFEDGLVEFVPIRYGWNILDWSWRARVTAEGDVVDDAPRDRDRYINQNRYAYQAAAVECSGDADRPITFFAFEWENRRLGVSVKQVNLHAARNDGRNENAIMLLAMSAATSPRILGENIIE